MSARIALPLNEVNVVDLCDGDLLVRVNCIIYLSSLSIYLAERTAYAIDPYCCGGYDIYGASSAASPNKCAYPNVRCVAAARDPERNWMRSACVREYRGWREKQEGHTTVRYSIRQQVVQRTP